METIRDFEDFIFFLNKHAVKYLIVGGLAVIFHAKPRYTKDIDIWLEPETDNIQKANNALGEFGSPHFMSLPVKTTEILQLGVAPDRIDILLDLPGVSFSTAWNKKIISSYGDIDANWIDIDSLIQAKKLIDAPRHQEDVAVLLKIKKIRQNKQ